MNIKAILKKPYVFLTIIYCSIYVIWSLANPITIVPVYVENAPVKFRHLKGKSESFDLIFTANGKKYVTSCGDIQVPVEVCYQLSHYGKIIEANIIEFSHSCSSKGVCGAVFVNATFMLANNQRIYFNPPKKQVNDTIQRYNLYREFLLILFYVINISILYLWRYYYVKKIV